MKVVWKVSRKALIAVFVLLAALIVVYLTCFHKMVIVSDIAFATNLSKTEFLPLRFYLLKNFYRLKLVEIDSRSLLDQELLTMALENLSKYDLVLLSPVTTTFCKLYSLDVSSLLDNSLTVGISKDGFNLFDVTLDGSEITVPEGSVDYRYRYTEEDAHSVVIPDFITSLRPYLKLKKADANFTNGILYYAESEIR